MRKSRLPERFLLAFIVMLALSWVLGLLYLPLALGGPLAAGAVFVRFGAGVTKRTPLSGAGTAAGALAVLIAPLIVIAWIIATATSDPGESNNLFEAALDFDTNAERVRSTVLIALSAIALAAAGGAIAAWLHGRQLDRSYWVTDE